jgi:hypothetical protein
MAVPLWLRLRRSSALVDPHRGRQLTFHGYTVLLTHPDGAISADAGLGLFDFDTRVFSQYRLLVDGRPPQCDTAAVVESDDWAGHFELVARC